MTAPFDQSPEAVRLCRRHLAGAASLEALCFSEPWSEQALELLLGAEATGFAVLRGESVIAYGGMLFAPGEGQITNIAVHPDFRRHGAGKAILSALLDSAWEHGAESVSLEVRESNLAAVTLYENAGFTVAGRRKHFYRHPPEDALVMIAAHRDANGRAALPVKEL